MLRCWTCCIFWWLVAAERDAAKGRILLQHFSLRTAEAVNVQEGASDPPMPLDGGTSSRMMVFAVVLLMSLLCILMDVVGRFLSHIAVLVWDDCESASETRSQLEPEKELKALAFVRLLGAVHLVMYFYGPAWCAGFNAWGASWFALYFILTGLGSAYVKLERKVTSGWLPRWGSLLRHLALVYPLYLLALCWQLVNMRIFGSQEPIVFSSLLCESLMLQAFLPQKMLHHYNPPSTFFSALAFCWLLEDALYNLGSLCWGSGRWGRRITCLGVLIWIILWPFAAPGKLVDLQDNIPAFSFIHCYFSGVLLAHCLHDKPAVGSKRGSAISASGSALILVTVFCGFSDKATATSWAYFLLLPAQCLLIYGLGRGEDPLAWCFSVWPLPRLSELALGIYIFQSPAKLMLDNLMGWQGSYTLSQVVLLLSLLAMLAAMAQLLQKPLARLVTS